MMFFARWSRMAPVSLCLRHRTPVGSRAAIKLADFLRKSSDRPTAVPTSSRGQARHVVVCVLNRTSGSRKAD